MSTEELQKYLAFAKALALEAGVIARQYTPNTTAVVSKNDNSPVTAADEAINALVIERVQQAYPDIGVLGEEQSSNAKPTDGLLWVCDPIDGTIAFVLGIPISTFCLALVEDGEPVVGVVYDFSHELLYSAAKGIGAFCNDQKLTPPSNNPLPIVPVEWWHSAPNDVSGLRETLQDAKFQTPNFASFSFTGLQLAAGKLSGGLYAGDKPWDLAAQYVVLVELGLKVTDMHGQPQRYDGPIKGAFIGKQDLYNELFGDE